MTNINCSSIIKEKYGGDLLQILGKHGLGKVLKLLLIIGLILSIPTVVMGPFLLNHTGQVLYSMIIIYPNGLLFIVMIYQFIKLFQSLEDNTPFIYTNVILLKRIGKLSLLMSIFWFLDLLFMLLIINNHYINYILVLAFLSLLFIGVFIALYILSELINQAVKYKEENDLTI